PGGRAALRASPAAAGPGRCTGADHRVVVADARARGAHPAPSARPDGLHPAAAPVTAPEGVWSQVIGQEAVVAERRGAVPHPAAMPHAWLFTGPPGSGRSVAARAFAAALQCPDGGDGTCHA